MKNLWPDSFEETNKPSPKLLLEEQSKLLPKLTKGIVFAEVVELSRVEAIQEHAGNDFAYRFNIVGKFLEGYKFKVMSFSHDIGLYPVLFRIDGELAKEIQIKDQLNRIKIASPESLEIFIEKVLKSDRIKNVIGSIMKLSK